MHNANEPEIYYSLNYVIHHNTLVRHFVLDTIKKEWDNLHWKQQIKHDLRIALGLTDMAKCYVAKDQEGLLDLYYFILMKEALEPLVEYVKNI